MQKKIIYLDRDGVINEDFGYVSKIENFKFVNGVFEACKEFLALGYELIVVTNQSGIGRNYYSEDEFLELTKYMRNEFKKEDIDILNVYYCPHNPDDNCSCRKPKTGMILQSLNDFEINLNFEEAKDGLIKAFKEVFEVEIFEDSLNEEEKKILEKIEEEK